MNGSLQLGRVAGIPVRLHWTFLLLLPVLASMLGGAWLTGFALILLLFGSVFLHELGHSLVARSFGIRVLDITFWPIGGMARMSEIPEVPRVEGWIAIAGPLVNFILAAGAGIALIVLGWFGAGSGWMGELASYILWVNMVLGIFNLVPAFPMDGGRLLRALLARDRSWLAATESAVRVGRTIAIATVMFSVASCVFRQEGVGPVLPLVAIFVWFQGSRELMATRLRHLPRSGGLGGLGVLNSLFQFTQSGGAGTPFGANGPFSGNRDPRQPDVDYPQPPPSSRPGGGFSAADIEALERFRGRLRDKNDR